MIRFGPAAAPRWFNQDTGRFAEYAALIRECGGSAIEFVLLPGGGSDELNRVHLIDRNWRSAIEIATANGLAINAHSPLSSEFGIANWNRDIAAFEDRFRPIANFLIDAESTAKHAPVFVLHAAAGQRQITERFLHWLTCLLERDGSKSKIALELRAPSIPGDRRFDTDLTTLTTFIAGVDNGRVGICWDIAHDWEANAAITTLTTDMIAAINHVHIHDSRADGAVHGPLDSGKIPWRDAVRQLQNAGWEGSITLEIRYRYATEVGDPWSVLRDNLLAVRTVLAGE